MPDVEGACRDVTWRYAADPDGNIIEVQRWS
jgi:hypothetical protein